MVEGSGVTREGRITPGCLGIYLDSHIDGLRRITGIYHDQHIPVGIQLAHSGRKGSAAVPLRGAQPLVLSAPKLAWEAIAPSAIAMTDGWPVPREMTVREIEATIDAFAVAAAREIENGFYVNLGIGIPTQISNHIPDDVHVTFHSENGMLGIGPFPYKDQVDPDLINAGKQTVTELPTTSYFSSADSFGMIRGGHIDLAILGAMQVSQDGDLANWMVPGKMVKGIGGAMDLVAGVKRVVVITDHVTRDGSPKLLEKCSMPLTGTRVVDRVISNLGVIDIAGNGFKVVELAPGVPLADVEVQTGAPIIPINAGG